MQALADLERAGPSRSVAAYARDRLSEHLWAVGQPDAALSALPELPTPADNLALWQSWHERLLKPLGPDHPDTLATRHNIADWTGRAGDARAALELFTALLPDRQRILGPDHPDTLTTRANIAVWTGQAGDARAALELFTALLPDRQRILGPDHPDTLTTRHHIADWTGRAGDARAALQLFTALLPDRQRILGPDHPDTLTTRAQHRRLDRAGRGRPRRTGVVQRAAARPAAGPRSRPPGDPHGSAPAMPAGPGRRATRAGPASCSRRCCPTSSGCSAPTTQTP